MRKNKEEKSEPDETSVWKGVKLIIDKPSAALKSSGRGGGQRRGSAGTNTTLESPGEIPTSENFLIQKKQAEGRRRTREPGCLGKKHQEKHLSNKMGRKMPRRCQK